MSDLPDESVQCVVTSPPYWGLRRYSGEQELIWGDNHCEHQWGIADTKEMNYVQGNPEFARPHREHKNFTATTNTCSLCGAWKGAYGLEPTPEMYIEHTIEILREIRRVLRKDGVVFWNIGDSYNSGAAGNTVPSKTGKINYFRSDATRGKQQKQINDGVLKPKDLCLIPFRVAISAQADGWWVRSVIIWSKPNPMPESVTDRPTESHEYILMLTKSAKYYWDADAVREPFNPATINRARYDWDMEAQTKSQAYVAEGLYGRDAKQMNRATADKINSGELTGRNIRSVWEFSTQPYAKAHFAVFPEKLPGICIKAATPEVGCCSKCGAPWERILDREDKRHWTERNDYTGGKYPLGQSIRNDGRADFAVPQFMERGWQPTCKCNADKVPSIVLDPFLGAGTTLWVAKKLNRRAVGYEISKEYCDLALDRNRQQVLC